MTWRALLSAPCLALMLALAPAGGMAQADGSPAAVPAAVLETLRIPELLEVMHDEGMDYGRTLAEQMFDNADEPGWEATVGAIYDTGRMRAVFAEGFDRVIAEDPALAAEGAAFFSGEPGAKIIGLELEARRALLDPDVEDAARLAFQDMVAAGDPRIDLLEGFARTNDLIEANVAGALNANLAFLKGMAAAGQTEDDLLAEVWAQETQVRAETRDWLFPFLALAYQPLTDEELRAYVEFSASPAGQLLNRALFAGFDGVFVLVSGDLGEAAGLELRGRDI